MEKEKGRMFNAIKLIYLVKERSALYDSRHEFHKNKEYTASLWSEVASQMRISEREVKSKWQNLRSNYMREKRKLETPGPHNVLITWPYFSLMSFLDDFSRVYKRYYTFNENSSGAASPEYIVPDDDEDCRLIIDSETKSDYDVTIVEEPSSTSFLGKRRWEEAEYKPVIKPERTYSNSSVSSSAQKQVSNTKCDDKSKDPDMLFLHSLFPSIKELTPLRNLEFKEEVLQLLKRKLLESVSDE